VEVEEPQIKAGPDSPIAEVEETDKGGTMVIKHWTGILHHVVSLRETPLI
jgi:hypothetical protein